ncbi:right-handed parallel beta-helix repeat-containing protein [Flammeovirga yaeyamensis]|uniref:Right-handed parallel beta-helix repeat-containing protein n=1 Tax=Flammeovirga yaeyamensis TaxID=367791 RepID=A0AAX1NEX6_9BACT|nr:right-handed parallel beta-helix repeat-containing protein [Flammeovirga yaeyamensis]MBB3696669.1 hypothetical protein [Flammeovirga yaeyamensis]NMF33342.1 right-handed parallel beta-helix repeat-containing protein [Flammeovirga yaeyamensis]QWG05381.1 right-handed parallel beta-helix repeat-containing protein [Flammeovirga yaeyamensis]
MKKLIIVCSLLIPLIISAVAVSKDDTIKIKHTKEIADDATPYVLNQLLENKAAKEIVFEKGVYHFYPDKGLNQFVYLSNHRDVFVRTAFPIINYDGFTIDGQGSTFIFHGTMLPFHVMESQNVEIKNVTVDWAMAFHSEGEVVKHDEKNHTFDVKFFDEYPYELRNGEINFIKEYYEHDLGQTIIYDKERKAISYNCIASTPISTVQKTKVRHNTDKVKYKYKVDKADLTLRKNGVENRIRMEEVEPGVVRFFNHKKELPPIGSILTTKGQQGLNRVAPAVSVKASKDFKIDNVVIHHAGGMGVIVENSENLTLNKLKITPSGDRVVSTTADATHFVGCRGKIEITNCYLENQLDDAINIHGAYQEVVEQLSDNQLGIRMGHHQQEGYHIGRAGDKIGLVRLDDSFTPYKEVTLENIKVINQRYQILTFKEKLPKGIVAGDYIENLTAYPEVLIEKNTFRGNRARGVLLSTPKKTVVRDNYFHTQMEAILVPVESSKWYESGSQANLYIEGNTFEDCNHGGADRGCIRLHTDENNENIAFKNINIKGNTFKMFDNTVLEVSNTDGLVFEGNTILPTNTFPRLHKDSPAFILKSSKNITFKNNDFKGKAPKLMETDKKMSEVTFQ